MSAPGLDLYKAASEYLAVRRALGFQLRGHDRLLADFVGFLKEAGAATITNDLSLSWATRPEHAQSVRHGQRLCVVRDFAKYLHNLDPTVQVPPVGMLDCRRQYRAPYLYSQSEIAALIAATDRLRTPLQAATCRALFGLLAVTGMRVGEAIALNRDDVDLRIGVLDITKAKSGNGRQLPVHPSAVTALNEYSCRRDQLHHASASPAFFISDTGARLTYPSARVAFGRLIAHVGLKAPAGARKPTIHGLRHSFAVTTLREWYRDGVDVAARLPILSAYLGHAQPSSTYWYLHATPGLLAEAVHRLEQEAGEWL